MTGRPDDAGAGAGEMQAEQVERPAAAGPGDGPVAAGASEAEVSAGAPSEVSAAEAFDVGAGAVEQDIEQALEAARRERDEYLDMVRRVQADFENYKKRMVRQQTELLERAAEGLVLRLLPVVDAFDLARAHLEAEGSPEGNALLQAAGLLSDTLAKEGLERVDADAGTPFDPATHEAVEHQTAEDEGGPVVSEELRAGYRYKGRVVRPAMVRVRG